MADLADIHLRGTRAAQPAATTVAAGTLYFVTDESKTERASGTSGGFGVTWESYSLVGAGTGTVTSSGGPGSGDIAKFTSGTDITKATVTGSGSVVLATSPALITPALGTPASGVLTNCTGLPSSESAFVLIAENLLGSDVASVSFTSIPGTYRHLWLMCYGRLTEAVTDDYFYIQFNADSGANYDFQQITGSNTTVAGSAQYAQTKIRCGEMPGANSSSANQAGGGHILIPNYAQTTFYKTSNSLNGAIWGTATTSALAAGFAGLWRNTAAITRVDILPTANNFKTGCLFSLYGLK